ncbi:APC family permease [Pseudoclavibacter sp. CFCC 11306]|uniref:APC family permease n=1 Tax=Pseudoclavibacter sp. CFCC 11306 TaxID=1564493 RepID=UPI001CE4A6D0|nr:APC family permease [Pseudoclavibacter sp. CFCC 11306]
MTSSPQLDTDRRTTVDSKLGTGPSHGLRRHLGRLDMVLLTIAATLGIDTIAEIATGGGLESLTWVVILAVTFLFPYGLLISEAGSTFRQEGGPYVWVRLAFGRYAGGLASLLYWVTNPIWLGGSLAFIAAATWNAHIAPLPAGSLSDILFKLSFVWLAIGIAIISIRFGKILINIGAIVKVGLLAVLVLTAALYALQRGVQPMDASLLRPTAGGFLTIAPVLLFALLGFEAANGAAEEMRNPKRDVPRAIGAAGLTSAVCHLLPILALLAVLPADTLSGDSGILDALGEAFTVYGPAQPVLLWLSAVALLYIVLTQGSAWMIASDRVQAVSGADGAFPQYFGRFNTALGTPLRVNILSGVISTAFTLVATWVATSSSSSAFSVVLSVATTTLLLSYLLILPSVLRLRRRFPDVERPYVVPGGRWGAVVATVITLFWIIIGSFVALAPGVLEQMLGLPYDFGEQWGVSRLAVEALTLGTLGVLLAAHTIGYLFARHHRRVNHDGLTAEQLLENGFSEVTRTVRLARASAPEGAPRR